MKEDAIRPDNLFNTYLSLAKKDIDIYFKKSKFCYIDCPACGSSQNLFQFRKLGFDYEECCNCNTLFVNPRPLADAFIEYYKDSPSVRFWATNFYRETAEKRRELLIRPKAILVKDCIKKNLHPIPEKPCFIDIGAGYGVFCEELAKIIQGIKIIAVEPSLFLQEVCYEKDLLVIPKFFEDVEIEDLNGLNLIAATSFELLEHLHDPSKFIRKCCDLLPKGALLIITTLSWDGFDLQVLRERSNSIHPPHHINFFSKVGMITLLKRYKFDILELSTPGKLDVDIVSKRENDVNEPFLKKLINSDEQTKIALQKFLQDVKLSSHMMIVAKKR